MRDRPSEWTDLRKSPPRSDDVVIKQAIANVVSSGMRPGFDELVAPTTLVLLEPAVQHIGVHSLLPRQRSDRGAKPLARSNELGLELWRVSTMGALDCTSGDLGVFEHGVHDLLRAHDHARLRASTQDGVGRTLTLPHA